MPLRSLRRPRAVVLAAAASSAALLALPASNALAVPVTVAATGLEVPAGAIVDPAGHVWVSDHVAGFCRLTGGALDAASCLGGALPVKPGPGAAGQPAFQDPTPDAVGSGDEVAYVPDSAAGGSDLDVLRWDPAAQTFSLAKKIAMTNARPTSASVGPDGNVYVAFKASPSGDIERVSAPLSDAPSVEVVGHSDGAAVAAAGYDKRGALTVYTTDTAGIGQLHPSAAAPPTSTPSPFDVGVFGAPPAPMELTALFYDVDNHVLYAGTGIAAHVGPGLDVVERFNTDSGLSDQAYASGVSFVAGLGLDSAGNLLITDAPSINPGAGRLMLARDTVAPATPVVVSPAGDATIAPSDAVTFSSASDAALRWECSLDGGAFQPCATGRALPSLSDGRHTLIVRGTDRAGNVSAASAPVAFTVKTPPTPAAGTTPAVAPIQLGHAPAAPRPAQRVSYRVAGRRALRVSALLTPGTRVLRVRLYRLNGAHGQRMVASVVRRTGTAAKYRMTLRVPAGLARGRYRLVVSAGRVATALRPLSSLVFSIQR